MVCVYGMNVYAAISHTVAIQNVEKQVSGLSSSVDSLDAQYIRLSSAITPDVLPKHGFSQAQVSAFISRSVSLGSVALSGHEL
jgi:virulence-associated protein VapD